MIPSLLLAMLIGTGEFVPATAPPVAAVPGGELVVWAYAGMWTLLLVLLGALWFRQDALRREIDRLREQLGERPGRAGGDAPKATGT